MKPTALAIACAVVLAWFAPGASADEPTQGVGAKAPAAEVVQGAAKGKGKGMPAPPVVEVLPEEEVKGKAQVPTVDVIMLPAKGETALEPPARKKGMEDAESWPTPEEAGQ